MRRRPLLAAFWFMAACLVLLLAVTAIAGAVLFLPPAEATVRAMPATTRRLVERRGGVYTPLSAMAPALPAGVVAIEDRRFFTHGALDLLSLGRVAWDTVRTGRVVDGGATIDLQLARQFTPVRDNQPRSVAQMIVTAFVEDARYPKRRLLELYLNRIYFGRGAYGVDEAAAVYFRTTPARLTVAQAAFLAGLPQAPSRYGGHPRSSATRQRYREVVAAMARNGALPRADIGAVLAAYPFR